jgi:hypothetical protein
VTGPSSEALLAAWEQGLAEPHAIGRTLSLLAVACPDVAPLSLSLLRIGERDAVLMQLQEKLFGCHVSALANCAGCGQRVELSFDLAEVRASDPCEQSGNLTASWEQYQVEFRLPNSRDLLALIGQEDYEEIERMRVRLLERIIVRARYGERPVAAQELPEELISAMEAEMQAADPQAEINLRLCCQSCNCEWTALFDPGIFLWKEVDAWAIRLLQEVHFLATAYGWREADILTMTPWRRHAYLEMLSV